MLMYYSFHAFSRVIGRKSHGEHVRDDRWRHFNTTCILVPTYNVFHSGVSGLRRALPGYNI